MSRQPSPLGLGLRAQRARVGAGAGLGQRERADLLAARERRDELAASAPRCRTAAIGSVAALVCTATVTPIPASAREISSSTSMYETKSAPAPPQLLGDADAHEPQLGELGDELVREAVLAVPRGGVRRDLGVGELARDRLDLALLGVSSNSTAQNSLEGVGRSGTTASPTRDAFAL